jgi:hypothetical protein
MMLVEAQKLNNIELASGYPFEAKLETAILTLFYLILAAVFLRVFFHCIHMCQSYETLSIKHNVVYRSKMYRKVDDPEFSQYRTFYAKDRAKEFGSEVSPNPNDAS